MPQNAEEWLKFDVIVLSDVGPNLLPGSVQRILANFVEKRGGTLIVVAGPEFMPRAYLGSALADLLPVESTPSRAKSWGASDSAYRLA